MRITAFTLILLISTPLLHTAGALRLALTRTATPFAGDCPIFMPGSTPEMQPWRYHSTRRPLAELLAPYEKGLKNMDPALKKALRTPVLDRNSDQERLRTALFARISGELKLEDVDRAILRNDHELVAVLLASRRRGKIYTGRFIDKAAQTNNLKTLACLMEHSFKSEWHEAGWQWGRFSAETIKFLLAHGAKIPKKISLYDRELSGDRYPSDAIFGDLFCSAFARAYSQDPKMYDVSQKAELLKIAIILASNGDPFSFQVDNPMSWEESRPLLKPHIANSKL